MIRSIILYGLLLATLVLVMKLLDYQFFTKSLSMEIYVGLVATFFTALGVWLGWKLLERNAARKEQIASVVQDNNVELVEPKDAGLSTREFEVLKLIAEGHSNKEIAEQLFISANTVKTHSSNLFSKLGVQRRTQAVQKARELRIIP